MKQDNPPSSSVSYRMLSGGTLLVAYERASMDPDSSEAIGMRAEIARRKLTLV